MHLLSLLRPETTVFYLDTELFFPETYALRDRLQQQLGLRFTRVTAEFGLDEQAKRYGPQLWARDPDQCCHLRKVAPLRRFLVGQQAWITGVRNGHTSQRAEAAVVEWDTINGLVKLNPLVRWNRQQVWEYLRQNNLPVNALHAEGYPSIGCRPCTVPVKPGEDPRSGRWAGFQKTECGIHGPSNSRLLRIGRKLEEQAG
jgi:phosphoadenosine phosphosulfate reductase